MLPTRKGEEVDSTIGIVKRFVEKLLKSRRQKQKTADESKAKTSCQLPTIY